MPSKGNHASEIACETACEVRGDAGGRAPKLALIGCGGQAWAAHGPAMRLYKERHEGVRLAACCDLDASAAGRFRERFGFERTYADYRQMLEREQPDAVVLSVPERYIAPVSCDVLERGFPLLLEKPPGMTSQEARRLAQTAERCKVAHKAAFNRRSMPLTRELTARIGPLLASSRMYSLEYDLVRVRRTDSDFATTAIHAIDTARSLAISDYASASFHYRELPHMGDGVADMTVTGSFANGIVYRLGLHPVSGINVERVVLRGEECSFELTFPVWGDPFAAGKLICTERGKSTSWHEPEGDNPLIAFGYYDQLADFLEELEEGRPSSGDWQSALQAVELMECLRLRQSEWRLN